MPANSVAILQSETPNLDLPPAQFWADDDDCFDIYDDGMMFTWSTGAGSSDWIAGGSVIAGAPMPARRTPTTDRTS